MKVKAIFKGYYQNQVIREGHVFVLASKEDYSEKWMEKLEADKKPARSRKPAKVEPEKPADPVSGDEVL